MFSKEKLHDNSNNLKIEGRGGGTNGLNMAPLLTLAIHDKKRMKNENGE